VDLSFRPRRAECPSCGTATSFGASRCPNCGRRLSRYRTILRSWYALLFLLPLAGALLGYAAALVVWNGHQAEAKVLVGSLTDPNYDQLLGYQELAQTYAQVATTTSVLGRVTDQLELNVDPASLAARIDAHAAPGRNIVSIIATAPSSAEALQLADAVAGEVTRLAQAPGSAVSLAAVVQPATPADASPGPPVVALLGAAIGLILAAALVRPRRTETGTMALQPTAAPVGGAEHPMSR
jgi:capsular polysaccharide biosynthesis protein